MRPTLAHCCAFLPIVYLGMAACSQTDENGSSKTTDPFGPGEVAIVNGARLAESVFRLYTAESIQASADDLTEEGRAEIIRRLIQIQLLSQEAERTGLDREPGIAAEIELYRMQALARHMVDRFAAEHPPDEADLRELYRAQQARFAITRYKTRHILVEDESLASQLIEELQSGADFADLALQHSTGPTGPEAGDLGWITADSVVEPFARAIESATPGIFYPIPVQTQYGWHVILVESREENVAPGLDAVRADLLVEARARKLDEFAASLREAAAIQTN